MGESERGKGRGGARAVAPVVGLALLLAFVILGALTVFAVAGGAVSDLSAEADVEQAADAMDAAAHDLRSSGYASAELPNQGDSYVDPEAGWVRIEVGNETVVDEDEGRLGAVYYVSGDTTLALQGGGVWRTQGGDSTMETPPPIEYTTGEDPMLSLPVISIDESEGRVARGRLSTVDTSSEFPDATASNPIEDNVTITVHSEFYDAWGAYFEQAFDAEVTYDHAGRNASVTLLGGDVNRTTTTERDVDDPEGVHGLLVNDGGTLDVRQDMVVDSYDSSQGPYPAGPNDQADIRTKGDLNVANDIHVHGDVEVMDGHADFSNAFTIEGDTVVGEGSPYTNVHASSPGSSTFVGLFSTKTDLDVAGGVHFRDDVIVGGDVRSFDGQVDGSMHVHGDMEDAGSYEGTIAGDLVVEGDVDLAGSSLTVQGQVIDDPSDEELRDPVDPVIALPDPGVDIDQKGSELSHPSNNDNDDTSSISGNNLQDCGTGWGGTACTLENGSYYLQGIDLNEETGLIGGPERLVLDTTDGPIELYVDGETRVHELGSIEVQHDPTDPHPVRIYSNDRFRVERGAAVTVQQDRSPLLELYMQPDSQWRIEGGSTFVGHVYGLSDGSQRTEIDVSGGSGSEVYGGFVGEIGEFDQQGEAHHDAALAEGTIQDPDDADETTEEYVTTDADVVYLHVQQRDVEAG